MGYEERDQLKEWMAKIYALPSSISLTINKWFSSNFLDNSGED